MKNFKSARMLIMGIIVGVLMMGGTIFAANVAVPIRSAVPNTVNVLFNGVELDLEVPLISVVFDDSENNYFRNYMPVRAVLEGMGYDVDWVGETETVLVTRPKAGLHGLTVFWGRTGNRVHISETCRSFNLTPHRGRIEDAADAGRFGWCQICSYGLEERFPIYHLWELATE